MAFRHSPNKIVVHHFQVWDQMRGEFVVPPLKSPAARIIEQAKGQIIAGTAEEVDASALDQHGRYDPAKLDAVDVTLDELRAAVRRVGPDPRTVWVELVGRTARRPKATSFGERLRSRLRK
jgi:hypothetical protein